MSLLFRNPKSEMQNPIPPQYKAIKQPFFSFKLFNLVNDKQGIERGV